MMKPITYDEFKKAEKVIKENAEPIVEKVADMGEFHRAIQDTLQRYNGAYTRDAFSFLVGRLKGDNPDISQGIDKILLSTKG